VQAPARRPKVVGVQVASMQTPKEVVARAVESLRAG
jgi:hypothetical protein